jgi:hypothetical protein
MKKIISLTLLAAVLLFAAVPIGKTKNKSYYSGDAISYNGQLVVASANTDSLEIFKLNGANLERISRTRPLEARFNRYGSYYEVKLIEENGQLYAYAITDFKIDKYNISALDASPILENNLSNTYWEWYGGLEKLGNNHYLTIGNKGVKLLNQDLQVIDSYDFKNTQNQYNIQVSADGRYLLDITGNTLRVFDRQSRTVINEISLNYNKNLENRRASMDANGDIFVADDVYTKKFSLDGTTKASFRHLDQPAFDTVLSDSSLYFSNGVGVVKLAKSDLKLLDYKYTSSYGGNGWAMGLKVVSSDNGDRVISFNNSGILVLDQNLEKLAFFVGDTDEEEISAPTENLWLKTDSYSAKEGSTVKLSGGGFAAREKLVIYFAGAGNQETTADNQGRFTSDLKVPPISDSQKKLVDIKVVGSSKLSYSSSFTIEK